METKNANFKLGQSFGKRSEIENLDPGDIITKLKFDQEGKYLAIGDQAGRVIMFTSGANERK